MLRRPDHPAHWATFQVPLRFNKFDIRDYLWNLYGVESTRVRSWVKHAALEREGSRTFRPPMTKIMTVEMTKPFAWPEEPEDKEPWHNKLYQERRKGQDDKWQVQSEASRGKLRSPAQEGKMSKARKQLREHAEAFITGEKEWKTDAKLDDKWTSK